MPARVPGDIFLGLNAFKRSLTAWDYRRRRDSGTGVSAVQGPATEALFTSSQSIWVRQPSVTAH